MESVISKTHQLWESSFCWKCWKFNIDFKNAKKIPKNIFCFWDNSIWIACVNFCLLREQYLLQAVNVLTNSLKFFHITKRDFFQRDCFKNTSKNMVKVLLFRFSIVLTRLPCWLSKGPLKRGFLDNYSTTFFVVRNSGNISAMRVILFLKMFKI